MRKLVLFLLLIILPAGGFVVRGTESEAVAMSESYRLYTELGLEGLVDYTGFEQALEGYNKINGRKKELLTIIDFTKPSNEDRLYVIDMKIRAVVMSTLVSHGKGSGDKYATSFSNANGSSKSSLGFYLTEETYSGRNGYSLRLAGLERGINDQARMRSVVIHGADYCDPSFVKAYGRLGRSNGCPAVPFSITEEIIDLLEGGALIYIYADNDNYLARSEILSAPSIASRGVM